MDVFNRDFDGDLTLEEEIGPAYSDIQSETAEDEPPCVKLSKLIRDQCSSKKLFGLSVKSPAILLVEDDSFVAEEYGVYLRRAGFSICIANSPEEAFCCAESYRHFAAVIFDVRMHSAGLFGSFESSNGQRTGLLLGQELTNHLPDSVFIALTNSTDAFVEEWFSQDSESGFHFCAKSEYPPKRFAKFVQKKVMNKPLGLKAFIVHGHDRTALLDLKNYLQNRLGFPEPMILQEKASGAQTVIEKFEQYSADIDVAFVLLTPDDIVDREPSGSGRARQNVIFELGFFVGKFGRRSGRVIVLAKKGVEMLSDLSGVLYIDITDGIEAAGEKIRLELESLV